MGWRPGWIYFTASTAKDENYDGIIKTLEENRIPYSTSYSPEHGAPFSIFIRKKDKDLVSRLTDKFFLKIRNLKPESGLEARTSA